MVELNLTFINSDPKYEWYKSQLNSRDYQIEVFLKIWPYTVLKKKKTSGIKT